MIEQEIQKLRHFMDRVAGNAVTSIGYPFAKGNNYHELYSLLRYPLINLGDPFIESNYQVNSFAIEREVVEFFADLFRAPKDDYSGYVTNGGSEGNLYGLYLARERYPEGIVYYSSESHYSIPKSIRLLNMKSIEISAGYSGEINYDELEESMKQHAHLPVIIAANIGTTMKEAKDDISVISDMIRKLDIEHYYIHCDAALAGVYLPLVEEDPTFDFKKGADSIACSGHKFIGSPIPCGIIVVKKKHVENLAHQYVSYIGSLDTTIGGSRNGFTPVVLWYTLKQQGRDGLLRSALESLALAEYTQNMFQELGISSYRNKNAITVVFPKPSEFICKKWQLATREDYAHLICMPGISKEVIDHFFSDLSKELHAAYVCK
ncbi:histidine decarboxylase [Chryseobacterium sp.]|uniref:histidine decarboxylase n=1 Tax=Chryseobacterium sp. TaxID=1871047 RepID=UPI00334083F8